MSSPPLTCINITGFALQLLQRRLHISREIPLVVVAAERPSAMILECNTAAGERGITVGMRYSQALALSSQVRAGVAPPQLREAALSDLRDVLRGFSPAVESWPAMDGVFWLSSAGLERLFGGEDPWVGSLEAAVRRQGWLGRLSRGWTRAGTFLAAGEEDGPARFPSQEAERVWAAQREVSALPVEARDRERLAFLGVQRVGQFLRLSEGALRRRFSRSTVELRSFLAGGEDEVPVQGIGDREPLRRVQRFEPPLTTREGLQHAAGESLRSLLREVASRGVWIEAMELTIDAERREPVSEEIRCGHATRDEAYLQRLLSLRFEHITWRRRFVHRLVVAVRISTGTEAQGELALYERPEGYGAREFSAPSAEVLDRTIAQLQAELDDTALSKVVVTAGRFPEERFALVPLEHGRELLDRSRVTPRGKTAPLRRRRRIVTVEEGVSPPPVRFRRLAGPFLLSSAWWDGRDEDRLYDYRGGGDGTVVWGYRRRDGTGYHRQGWLE